MLFEFNKHGNLPNDLILSCIEFFKLFSYNKKREKLINNLFIVANQFKGLGCDKMFVFGSFATQKKNPNDIDVCFDISKLDVKIVEKNSSVIDNYERRRFKEYFLVHVTLKEIEDINIIRWMKRDRNSNERGIIEVSLQDLPVYDKK